MLVLLEFQVAPATFNTLPLPASAAPLRRAFRSMSALVWVTVPSLRKMRPPSRRRPPLLMVETPCKVVIAAPEWPLSAMAAGPRIVKLPAPEICAAR